MDKDEFEEVYQVIEFLDDLMSAGKFAEVDDFLDHINVDEVTNSAYLLAVVNYAWMAKERGDILASGDNYCQRARERLVTLVGEERTARLMQHRGG